MEHFDLYRQIPDEWLGLDERVILQKLKKPTIFHCPGHDPLRCVVVSCLLRGSESSGYIAVIEELKRNARGVSRYRHDVIFLIGNVEAAKLQPYFENSFLESGPDLKRVWKDGVEIADEWALFIKEKYPISFIDLTNSFGNTAPFSVWARDDEPTRRLANVLAGTHVCLQDNQRSFVGFNSRFAPAVSVNCGRRMTGQSDEHARITLQRFFLATQIVRGNPERYFFRKIFTNVQPISVQDGVPFFFGSVAVQGQVIIRKDLDKLNFLDSKPGELLGWAPKNYLVFKKGQLPADDLFDCTDGEIRLKKPAIIALASCDEKTAKADGVFSIVEELI